MQRRSGLSDPDRRGEEEEEKALQVYSPYGDNQAPLDLEAATRAHNHHHLGNTDLNPFTWIRKLLFRHPPHSVDYREFITRVEPGDIVLMSSNGFYAFMQEFFTSSPYSHVCMPYVKDGKVWLAESTFREHGIVDKMTGKEKSGPMVVRFWDRAYQYMTKIGYRIVWRRLNPNNRTISHEERARRVAAIEEVMRSKVNYSFDSHVPDLMSASIKDMRVFPFFYLKYPFVHDNQQFCSSLVSEILMHMGVLQSQGGKHVWEYAPRDFTYGEQSMDLLGNYGYGQEIEIVFQGEK